jgi:Tfp pilus assembly protein PilF
MRDDGGISISAGSPFIRHLPFTQRRFAVNRLVRWQTLLGFVGLFPVVGCDTLSGARTSSSIPVHSDTPISKAAPLPPRQTAEICMNLADKLEKDGFDAEAIAHYEKARQDNPSLRLERKLAVLYDKVGDPKRAMEEFDKALKQTPNDPGLLNNVGFCLYNQRKFDQAETHLRRALSLDPKHKFATVNLGLTLAQQGKYDESLKVQAKVLSDAEAYSNVAFVMTAQGKRDEAKELYRQALHCDPQLAIAKLALDRLENPGKGAAANVKPGQGPIAQRRAARDYPADEAPARVEMPDQSPVVIDSPARRKDEPN